MYNEIIPGFYLCKYEQGVAYYLVSKKAYDAWHIAFNGQSATNINGASTVVATINHILHGNSYIAGLTKIKLANWEDMPLSYQQDAIASNEEIRKRYHEGIYGTKPTEVQDLKGKLFVLVDKATNTFRTLKATGANHTSTRVGTVPVLEVAEYIHSEPMNWPRDVEVSKNQQKVGSNVSAQGTWQEENKIDKVQTSNMDLLSNIPGMSLDFGKLAKGLIALSFSGDIAFSDKKGGYVTIQHEGTEKTRVDVGSLKFDVDFYKVPTQELEEGDVILLDNEFLIAGKKTNGDTAFINPLTGAKTNKLQRSNILGMYFYTKIVSLFDMVGGEAKGLGLGGLNPMTLMLLSGNGGGLGEGNDIGKLLLFSQLGQGGGDMQSMLPLLLMSGNSGLGGDSMNSMLPLLMMGNKGGLGNLFGGKKKVAPKAVAKKKAPVKKTNNKTAVAKG